MKNLVIRRNTSTTIQNPTENDYSLPEPYRFQKPYSTHTSETNKLLQMIVVILTMVFFGIVAIATKIEFLGAKL